jgi:hypothetical protein
MNDVEISGALDTGHSPHDFVTVRNVLVGSHCLIPCHGGPSGKQKSVFTGAFSLSASSIFDSAGRGKWLVTRPFVTLAPPSVRFFDGSRSSPDASSNYQEMLCKPVNRSSCGLVFRPRLVKKRPGRLLTRSDRRDTVAELRWSKQF